MSSTALIIENLGKSFQINPAEPGLSKPSYSRLNEAIQNRIQALFRRSSSPAAHPATTDFWALKDVNLTFRKGERIGFIGGNGAGKSTLLKILSRITYPTTGRFEIFGRMSSLLEVGTGFHPELTGRENIFLNGSILGMTRAEILSKMDEIIAFSDIERFLDLPVKRLSSGMQVRLAFSIAAHLDTEVMIIDEVLAVGDSRFQKKCLGKMNDVAHDSGKTILFVSHSMNAVESLCSRVIWMQSGQVRQDSTSVKSVIDDYLIESEDTAHSTQWQNPGNVLDNDFFRPLRFYVKGEDPSPNNLERSFQIEIDLKQRDPRLMLGLAFFTEDNHIIAITYFTDTHPPLLSTFFHGPVTLVCLLPAHLLNEGKYRVELVARIHQGEFITDLSRCPVAIHFQIRGGLSSSPYWTERRPGLIAPLIQWTAS